MCYRNFDWKLKYDSLLLLVRCVQSSTNDLHCSSQRAFICNFREHWLTIRRLGAQWFNLNSLLTGPELISDTFLALTLAQLQRDGYSIYLVVGELPDCQVSDTTQYLLSQKRQICKNFLEKARLNRHTIYRTVNNVCFTKCDINLFSVLGIYLMLSNYVNLLFL